MIEYPVHTCLCFPRRGGDATVVAFVVLAPFCSLRISVTGAAICACYSLTHSSCDSAAEDTQPEVPNDNEDVLREDNLREIDREQQQMLIDDAAPDAAPRAEGSAALDASISADSLEQLLNPVHTEVPKHPSSRSIGRKSAKQDKLSEDIVSLGLKLRILQVELTTPDILRLRMEMTQSIDEKTNHLAILKKEAERKRHARSTKKKKLLLSVPDDHPAVAPKPGRPLFADVHPEILGHVYEWVDSGSAAPKDRHLQPRKSVRTFDDIVELAHQAGYHIR